MAILELSDEDLAGLDLDDASTADWEALLGAPTLTARDFMTSTCCGAYDPVSLDFRIWMGWNDSHNRIYCAVERADDLLLPTYREEGSDPTQWTYRSFYQQDYMVQFDVDGDASGVDDEWFSFGIPETREEEVALMDAAHRTNQWYWVVGALEGDHPKIYLVENAFQYLVSWFQEPPYAYADGGRFGEQPTIDVSEFYVTPFDLLVWDDENESVVSDLRSGHTILFNFVLIDRDVPTIVSSPPDAMFDFPGPGPGWHTNKQAGLLVPRVAGHDGGVASAISRSWAAVKSVVTNGFADGGE